MSSTTPSKRDQGVTTPKSPRATARQRSGKGRGADQTGRIDDANVRFVIKMAIPGRDVKEMVLVDLKAMTMRERDDARRAINRLTAPDFEDWTIIHGWVFLRRIPEFQDVNLDEIYDLPWGEAFERVELTPEIEVLFHPEGLGVSFK